MKIIGTETFCDNSTIPRNFPKSLKVNLSIHAEKIVFMRNNLNQDQLEIWRKKHIELLQSIVNKDAINAMKNYELEI